jgi:hypothetical protein
MRFAKCGFIIENNNPVFDELYLKQGWSPVPVIDSSNDIKKKVNVGKQDKTDPATDLKTEEKATDDTNIPLNPVEEELAKLEKDSKPEKASTQKKPVSQTKTTVKRTSTKKK